MSLASSQEIINQDIDEIIQAVGGGYFQPLAGTDMLITGPQGLLGGYIVDTIARLNETVLRNSPCRVIGLSRSPVTTTSRLGHLLNKEHFTFHQHEVSRAYPFNDGFSPDFIIHAAGRSAPSIFTLDPIGTIDVNVSALRWLLDMAAQRKTQSFSFFSSSEVYGNPPPQWIPTPETYHGNSDSLGARGAYTEAKRCGEAMCLAFHITHAVPVKILRPALIYGPGLPVDDKRVISDFINQGVKGQSIQLRDDGLARRCYCYIKDAMIVFWKAFLSDRNGEVFNIGGIPTMETTIKDLAILVQSICGMEAEPRGGTLPSLAGSPDRVCVDMEKVRKTFGYLPETPLADGLRATIAWVKERSRG